jgi:hypothetical protein
VVKVKSQPGAWEPQNPIVGRKNASPKTANSASWPHVTHYSATGFSIVPRAKLYGHVDHFFFKVHRIQTSIGIGIPVLQGFSPSRSFPRLLCLALDEDFRRAIVTS